jgi:hypothetical protein
MKRAAVLPFVLLPILGALSTAPPAGATPPIQRHARAAGYPASDCTYCHAFTMDHMRQKAIEMKIAPMNCYACHGNRLPKSGKALFNPRGQWLVDQKHARQASDVDVAWLKDYVPASPPATAKR